MKQLKVTFVMFGVFCILLLCITVLNGCGTGGGGGSSSSNVAPSEAPTNSLSQAKEITSFTLNTTSGIGTPGIIINHNIVVTVPFAAPISSLVASFTTTGVKVSALGIVQTSGQMSNDFSRPITYEVTAADGSTTAYTVEVLVAPITAKEITAFSLRSSINSTPYPGTIVGNNINVIVPFGTNPASLIATYKSSARYVQVGGVFQRNGRTVNDFTSPLSYTVADANNNTRTYNVTVTTASQNAKEITKFLLNGVLSEKINGTDINIVMPNGTDLSSLVATYITTGAHVSVNGTSQSNTQTANDFSHGPLTYTVTAANGDVATYRVRVTTASDLANDITGFSLNGVEGTINGHNIQVSLPPDTDLTSVVAEFVTNGIGVNINGVSQVSSHTTVNFSGGPLTYTVSAANGNTAAYTVTVDSNTQTD
ncbi:MAG: hypothetical protein K0R14_1556 [Burkholderiales bacterium]|jgi:hypothetical protein|nr:hypothetical protein [Burkholderiales bacterium]